MRQASHLLGAQRALKMRRRIECVCRGCGTGFVIDNGKRHMHCGPCSREYYKIQHAAQMMTRREVYMHRLPRARDLACVDCGHPANGYDHRDYRKPLEVQAVCRACNTRRGPAIWKESAA